MAKPARCSAAKSQSPDRSPVNTRPVRLAPWAAGASPATSTRAAGSPNPGAGRPQYSSSRYAARFSRATVSRHSTRRGHARHPTISAVSASSADGVGTTGSYGRIVRGGRRGAGRALGFAAVRVVLVVNPAASSVTTRARVSLEALLSQRHELTVRETMHRGHAITLAREAAAAGADVVFELGGDGTLNEVADGLAGTTTALAVLPGGSTNVFARSLGDARRRGRRGADAARRARRGPGAARRPRLRPRDRRRLATIRVPPRRRLRRRGHRPHGATLVPEASLRPPGVRAHRVATPGCAATTGRVRSACGSATRRPACRPRALTWWCRTPTRTPTSATGA